MVPMARPGRSTGAPCPLWTPGRPSFHPAVSLHTIKPWTLHSRGAKVWHLPHNDLPWTSKPGHTMEIQAGSHNGDPSRFTQWRSKDGWHNGDPSHGDPKLVHTMEVTAGRHNGDPKPVHTMEIQAGSHNGDPSWFTQWRSKPVHTMEIQAGSHNGDPSRFTQWRSKPVHTMEIQAGSQNGGSSRFTQWISKPWRSIAASHNGGSSW